MKVVMFLAAHLGLLELAEDMLNGGVRADEPVGEECLSFNDHEAF